MALRGETMAEASKRAGDEGPREARPELGDVSEAPWQAGGVLSRDSLVAWLFFQTQNNPSPSSSSLRGASGGSVPRG